MKTFFRSLSIILSLALTPIAASANAPEIALPEELATSAIATEAGLSASVASLPLQVTAMDFITKVYGFIDTDMPSDSAAVESTRRINIAPAADTTGHWLDSADGYRVNYYGMMPEVSAMAQYGENGASEYCYFFLFPYEAGAREDANYDQSQFTGSLLQEMSDIGLMVGVPDCTDAIFEAFGSYDTNHINVRLTEETHEDSTGRFVLMLNVIPGAFTHTDFMLATNP